MLQDCSGCSAFVSGLAVDARSPCMAAQITFLLSVGLLSLHQGQLASY